MAISPLLCKPPGIHKNKKDRRCMLIDIADLPESNTSAKFRKKLSNYQDLEIEVNQGSYRSWKTWKAMKFKNVIFQAWKVMEFKLSVLEIQGKLKFCFVERGVIKQCIRHPFWWTPEFVSVKLLEVKRIPPN